MRIFQRNNAFVIFGQNFYYFKKEIINNILFKNSACILIINILTESFNINVKPVKHEKCYFFSMIFK